MAAEKKIQIKSMNPEKFTFENWESDFGGALDLSYHNFSYYVKGGRTPQDDYDELESALARKAIGWCDSSRLSVRPRNDGEIAVMVETEHGDVWFHVNPKCFINGKIEFID